MNNKKQAVKPKRTLIAQSLSFALGSGAFALAVDSLATPPAIVWPQPSPGQTQVGMASAGTDSFIFSFYVDQGPVSVASGKSVYVIASATGANVATISMSDSSKVSCANGLPGYGYQACTIDTGIVLTPSTNYYISLDGNVFLNASGEANAAASQFTSFSTSPAAIANYLYPSAGSTGISQSLRTLSLWFSEPMQAVSGKNIKILSAVDDSVLETIAANDTNKVSASLLQQGIVSFTFDSVLSGPVYINIDSGAFLGKYSNVGFAGISGKSSWNLSYTDTTAPSVVNFKPTLSDASFWTPHPALTVDFSEKVIPVSGKKIYIKYKSDNSLLEAIPVDDASRISLDSAGKKVTIKPWSYFFPSKNYYVTIDSGAFVDTAATPNAYPGITASSAWEFATSHAFPIILPYSPQNGQSNINFATGASNTFKLSFTVSDYDLEMAGNAPTLDASKSLYVYRLADNTLAKKVGLNDNAFHCISTTCFVDLGIALNPSTDYYVNVDAGLLLDNNGYPSSAVSGSALWSFRTLAGAEIVGGASSGGQQQSPVVIVSFSESLLPVAGKSIYVKRVSDNAIVETIAVTDTSKVELGDSRMVIRLNQTLAPGVYSIDMDAGALVGVTSGISSTATSIPVSYSSSYLYVNSDNTSPAVYSVSPASGASGFFADSPLKIYFNEAVVPVSGKNIYIKGQWGNIVETISVVDSSRVSIGNSGDYSSSDLVTIQPKNLLAYTNYYVEIDSGAFVDRATTPNAYSGMSGGSAWSFTTGDALPKLSWRYPFANQTNVAFGSAPSGGMQMVFSVSSESVTAAPGKYIYVKKLSDNTIVQSIAANDTSKISCSSYYWCQVDTGIPLSVNTSYYLNVDAGAYVSNSGQLSQGVADNTSFRFTTGPALAVSHTQANANSSPSFTINFSDYVFRDWFKYIYIKRVSDDSVVEAITTDYSNSQLNYSYPMPLSFGNSSSLSFSPSTALSDGSYYIAYDRKTFVSALTGNWASALSDKSAWTFTIAGGLLTTNSSGGNTGGGTGGSSGGSTGGGSGAGTSSGGGGAGGAPISVGSGASATVTGSGGIVNAGEGSKVQIENGVSGATINLTSNGANSQPVTVSIGGQEMSVKPLDSGSVVKTATVTVNGTDTTVLTVTSGKAQVAASGANQPLLALGSGSNAVLVSSSGNKASLTAAVDNNGNTTLTLAAPTGNQNTTDSAVKLTIGGQDITIKPQAGATDPVVTLKTVTIGGKETQVVSVTAGTAVLTASQPNQPLLAIGNSNNPIVITGNSVGSEATSSVANNGTITLVITSGSITLPANAFASDNSFAAIKDGKLYAGEVAVLNTAGKVDSVRLGSLNGDSVNTLGDPLSFAARSGFTRQNKVANLSGKAGRVSATQSYGDALVNTLGAGVANNGQNSDGVLRLRNGDITINALPLGSLTVDTNQADGVTVNASGSATIARSGVLATFVPSVTDPLHFFTLLTQADKNATLSQTSDGGLLATINGTVYSLLPAWTVANNAGGQAGLSLSSDGNILYQDANGNVQTLYPKFAEPAQLVQTFRSLDAKLTVVSNADGSVTATIQGKSYTLKPDLTQTSVPAEHAADAWWSGSDGRLYLKSADGKSAQGFSVK